MCVCFPDGSLMELAHPRWRELTACAWGTWEGRKGRCPAVLLLLSIALGEASVHDRGHEGPGRPAGGLETSVLSWLAGCVAVGTCQDPEARATQSDGHASAHVPALDPPDRRGQKPCPPR